MAKTKIERDMEYLTAKKRQHERNKQEYITAEITVHYQKIALELKNFSEEDICIKRKLRLEL